jgi:integrating conjugative element protein (TIGR03749 family)
MKLQQFLLLGACALPMLAWADRTIVWDKYPLTIVLPVGEEIRVTFPADVALQLPLDVTEKLESLAPNQRIVYWKAVEEFDSVRAIATSTDNETVYLVDLIAQKNAAVESIVIEDPDRILVEQGEHSESAVSASAIQELLDPPELILTRFASQTLYAPRRLMPVNPDINAQAISALPSNFPLMRSQKGEQYTFSVVGAWSGYGRYVSAVMVMNKSAVSVHINPGLVVGNFTHITAQHLTLGVAGSLEDRTTLYLVSDTPFASAIMEDGYGY